jgi:hypothetical protein
LLVALGLLPDASLPFVTLRADQQSGSKDWVLRSLNDMRRTSTTCEERA